MPLVLAKYLFIPFILIHSTVAFSQTARETRGRLQGSILDESGAAVPDVKIVVSDQLSGTAKSLHSDTIGRFKIDLPEGNYDVFVEKLGLCPDSRKGLGLRPRHELIVNFRLPVCGFRSGITSDVSTGRTEGFSDVVFPYRVKSFISNGSQNAVIYYGESVRENGHLVFSGFSSSGEQHRRVQFTFRAFRILADRIENSGSYFTAEGSVVFEDGEITRLYRRIRFVLEDSIRVIDAESTIRDG